LANYRPLDTGKTDEKKASARRDEGWPRASGGIGGIGAPVPSCGASVGASVGGSLLTGTGPAAQLPAAQQRSHIVSITGFHTFLFMVLSLRTSTLTFLTQQSDGGPQIFL
jgi:hypothetical protein